MRVKVLAFSLLLAAPLFAGDHFPYFFKRANGSISRFNASIDTIGGIDNRWSGNYIWLERNGKEYLIRDAAILAEAGQAFASRDALQPQADAAEARLRPIEQKYETLEERLDELSDRLEDEPALAAQVAEAERALDAVKPELHAAEQAEERIEREMDRREAIGEAEFEKIVLRAVEAGKAERVD
jgi:chromosome segregation ATPase